MALTFKQEMVSLKIDFLTKQRDYVVEQRTCLQNVVDDVNEVLELATSWLRNADNITFKDINKMIEDKLMFLSGTDICVHCEKISMQQDSATTRFLPAVSTAVDQHLSEISISTDQHLPEISTSTDQHLPEISTFTDQHLTEISTSTDQHLPEMSTFTDQHLPEISIFTDQLLTEISTSTDQHLKVASSSTDQSFTTEHAQVSDELKAIMNQMKVMQETISFLSKSTENISTKQLIMERCTQSLSAQCSKIEQEQIRKIETDLKNISEKQEKTAKLYDKRMNSFESKVQAITDAESHLKESWHLQQTKMKEQTSKHKKQSQTFTQDFNAVLENIQELNTRVFLLEDQVLIESQMEFLENKIKLLEENSKNLTAKLETNEIMFEEFTRTTEETFENMSSIQGREFENLEKFEEKIISLEKTWSSASKEAAKLCSDAEAKHKMLCQVVDDRLAPLEKLRDIFNKKLDDRKKNIKKLDSVYDKMTVLVPKMSQLEKIRGQVIGFSARLPFNMSLKTHGSVLRHFKEMISNCGDHFNSETGEFTAPLDGLYATSLCVNFVVKQCLHLIIVKAPCASCKNVSYCKQCIVGDIMSKKNTENGSVFVVLNLTSGDKLYALYSSVNQMINYVHSILFTCFRIEKIRGQVIGFSARLPFNMILKTHGSVLRHFKEMISNCGDHFNSETGEFTAPLDGLYATSLCVNFVVKQCLHLIIVKAPCALCKNVSYCKQCIVGDIMSKENAENGSVFVVVNLTSGDKLYTLYSSVNQMMHERSILFTCFRIG